MCPRHVYNCVQGTFYKRVFDTSLIVYLTRSISVSLTHSNMCFYPIYIWKKDKTIDTFQAITKFLSHGTEGVCVSVWQYRLQ